MSLNQTAHIDSRTQEIQKGTGNIRYKRINVEANLNVLLGFYTLFIF